MSDASFEVKLFHLTVCTGLHISAHLIQSVLYLHDSHKVNSDTQTQTEGSKNKSDEVFLSRINRFSLGPIEEGSKSLGRDGSRGGRGSS